MKFEIKYPKYKISLSKLGLLYILTMIFAEVHQAGLFSGYYLTPFIIALFWFGVAQLLYLQNGPKYYFQRDALYTVKVFIFPWFVFIGYNFFLYFVLNQGYTLFLKSSFVQIMFTPCILLGAWGAFYLFGKNTLRYLLYSFFVHYIIMLFVLFFRMGPTDFINGILTVFTGMSIGNPFEMNADILLALGLLSVFYLDFFIRKKSNVNNHFLLVLLLVLLGGKRIELLAILAIFAAGIAMIFLEEKRKNKMMYIVSLLMLAALFSFVYLVINGIFSSFAYSHGIDTMGRIKMWDYVAQYAKFGPTYLGNGYSFANLTLETDAVHTFNGHTYTLHSDILKVYFDLGFWMFLFWTIYNLFVLPKLFRDKYGYRIGNLCWKLMLFVFILYITDNAINYFITQTTLLIIIMHSIILNKEINNNS